MPNQNDLLSTKHVMEWIIYPTVFLALATFQIKKYWSDRERIRDEADSQHAEVLSIRWCLLPFLRGPFSFWECLPGCRLFRVRARDRSGEERIAYVLIGPRRVVSRWQSWESRREQWYGTLTWRWATSRRRTSD